MADQQQSQAPPPAATLRSLIGGYRMTQLIYVTAKLGIADALGDEAKSAEELAQAIQAHPQSLARLLRTLAVYEIFEESPDGRFGLAALGQLLQKEAPGSLHGFALLNGEPWIWQPWGELLHSVRTGQSAFHQVYDMGLYDYVHQHPDATTLFNEAMTSVLEQSLATLIPVYDFAQITTVVDVSGGHGALLSAFLQAYPHLHGVLCDLPETIEAARHYLEATGVADRCILRPGNFFEAVPDGGDAYILKSTLMDWDDAHAMKILTNCHHAMQSDARLLVIEDVISPDLTPDQRRLLGITDMHMMVLGSGGQRTEAEHRELLTTSGFTVTRIIPTSTTTKIIEAAPA